MENLREVIADDRNRCGESPIWDSITGTLYWTDIESSVIFSYCPATGNRQTIFTNFPVAGIALHSNPEQLIFGGPTGLNLWHLPTATVFPLYDGDDLAINDILADESGRIYAATAYFDGNGQMIKQANLSLFDTDGTVRTVDEGIELGNGMGLSGDGHTFYLTDSTARTIFVYDRDPASGNLQNRRPLVIVSKTEGLPDGLTVDADDHIWSAQWYGEQIVRYAPDGSVSERLPMPVLQVSSIGFGGLELTDMYITSAADVWRSPFAPTGYDFDAANVGGALYRVHTGYRGRSEHRALLPQTAFEKRKA